MPSPNGRTTESGGGAASSGSGGDAPGFVWHDAPTIRKRATKPKRSARAWGGSGRALERSPRFVTQLVSTHNEGFARPRWCAVLGPARGKTDWEHGTVEDPALRLDARVAGDVAEPNTLVRRIAEVARHLAQREVYQSTAACCRSDARCAPRQKGRDASLPSRRPRKLRPGSNRSRTPGSSDGQGPTGRIERKTLQTWTILATRSNVTTTRVPGSTRKNTRTPVGSISLRTSPTPSSASLFTSRTIQAASCHFTSRRSRVAGGCQATVKLTSSGAAAGAAPRSSARGLEQPSLPRPRRSLRETVARREGARCRTPPGRGRRRELERASVRSRN